MKKNILFILIDGLRADQVYGENKTSVTPNIDSLRKKGLYFTKAFSSVDGTIVSLNTIFSSRFQVGNTARSQRVVLQEKNLLINKLALIEKKNHMLTDNIDLDYLETLYRQKFMVGKKNEEIFVE